MIKVEHIKVFNLEGAVRGMRNPMNSWDKSDSFMCDDEHCCDCEHCEYDEHFKCKHYSYDIDGNYSGFILGESDLKLMRNLYKAGPEHAKFMRQIFVSMDITCNHFWWQEFDTYKVGVTRNSCSKMHKIHVKAFEADDFSHEGIYQVGGDIKEHFKKTLEKLEWLRQAFNATHERLYWRAMLELLPMGYNIKATVTMSYANAANMINQREGHPVAEWNDFIQVLKDLPNLAVIMG